MTNIPSVQIYTGGLYSFVLEANTALHKAKMLYANEEPGHEEKLISTVDWLTKMGSELVNQLNALTSNLAHQQVALQNMANDIKALQSTMAGKADAWHVTEVASKIEELAKEIPNLEAVQVGGEEWIKVKPKTNPLLDTSPFTLIAPQEAPF